MENKENNETFLQEDVSESSFNKVTPLSKYLAMILFIALPFIGGWVGYNYAPDKVVEVEKVVVRDVQPVNESAENNKNVVEEGLNQENIEWCGISIIYNPEVYSFLPEESVLSGTWLNKSFGPMIKKKITDPDPSVGEIEREYTSFRVACRKHEDYKTTYHKEQGNDLSADYILGINMGPTQRINTENYSILGDNIVNQVDDIFITEDSVFNPGSKSIGFISGDFFYSISFSNPDEMINNNDVTIDLVF